MQDMSINLKLAPHTPMFAADLGERVEFVVIGHGNTHHTFHLHGHRWAMTRTGTLATPDREAATTAQPRRRYSATRPAPMPREPPVTMTTLRCCSLMTSPGVSRWSAPGHWDAARAA